MLISMHVDHIIDADTDAPAMQVGANYADGSLHMTCSPAHFSRWAGAGMPIGGLGIDFEMIADYAAVGMDYDGRGGVPSFAHGVGRKTHDRLLAERREANRAAMPKPAGGPTRREQRLAMSR